MKVSSNASRIPASGQLSNQSSALVSLARKEQSQTEPARANLTKGSAMNTDSNEIPYECPKCKRHLSGDRALVGQTINCPNCNESSVLTPRIILESESEPMPAKPTRKMSFFQVVGYYLGLGIGIWAILLVLAAIGTPLYFLFGYTGSDNTRLCGVIAGSTLAIITTIILVPKK